MGFSDDRVTFTTPEGDLVSYAADKKGILQEVKPRGGGEWMRVGVASKLKYDKRRGNIVDQEGVAVVVPDSAIDSIAHLADKCGVRHNIKSSPQAVTFAAPSGDQITYAPHPSGRGIDELILENNGTWRSINTATILDYDPESRGLLDQDGLGGCLPAKGVDKLLQDIQNLAEACHVKTNIQEAIDHTRARKTHHRPRRHRSRLSAGREYREKEARERLTTDNFWSNFVMEAERIDNMFRPSRTPLYDAHDHTLF
eukprot:TRINITY_DN14968_c0_g1_i1.p1 TRINITY_DN14968_c0_g1~~TRINITY_DN14968_c0_g1_i1.p1  ORF type:complete len:255 (+),score=40.72 TRINITY_DN14968_c0_g1_i1:34-798(+)